ncbi:MAG: CvpA family protein [Rhodoferax sp.]|nr:CvpA family protein [Rhodoferax sp.]MDO8448947.1 CvpA family protein [Rhodoferax sp.]
MVTGPVGGAGGILVIAAFVLAQAFADEAGAWLPMGNLSPALRVAVGFVLVFVTVAFAAGLGAWLVQKLVASVGLRPVDRVLGGAFGLLRGVVILLAVALVVSMTQMQNAAWWADSNVAQVSTATLIEVKPLLPEPVARYIR